VARAGVARRLILFFAAFLAIASGCTRPSTMEAAFRSAFPDQDTNQSVVLEAIDPGGSTGSSGDLFTLLLRNQSGGPVVYNPSSDVHGMIWDEAAEQWLEVDNRVETADSSLIIGAEPGAAPSIDYVDFWPAESGAAPPYTLRIVVEADLLSESMVPQGKVIAFYDILVRQ